MKKTKFTEEQIALALHRSEDGTPIEEICRRLGVGHATFYRWKQKYGGLSGCNNKAEDEGYSSS